MNAFGYRGVGISVEGDNEISIELNGSPIDIETNDDQTVFGSALTFGEFESPESLARAVVDTQVGLANPMIDLGDVSEMSEASGLDVRRNVAELSDADRTKFRDAVFLLKERGEYDKYIKFHGFTDNLGHFGPAFYPWHRVFLRNFELELQNLSPESADVTLPYWDYTSANVDAAGGSAIWREDFFGMNGYVDLTWSGEDGTEQKWVLPGYEGLRGRIEQRDGIRRNPFSLTSRFVNPQAFNDALRHRDYRRFAPAFEGPPHGGAHVTLGVGGGNDQGNFATAVNDPFFMLLHCNVDRMWAKWQDLMREDWLADNPGQSYPATQLAEDYHWDKSDVAHTAPHTVHAARAMPDRHNLTDVMWPWDASKSHEDRPDSQMVTDADRRIYRPIDTLNHHDLGYTYDNIDPTGFVA